MHAETKNMHEYSLVHFLIADSLVITLSDIFICQALLHYISCTQQIMVSCAAASPFVLCFFLALDVYEFSYAIGYDSCVY
jgi:hypothetical protein